MYAGAVMVLYVFVVAYVGGSDQPLGTGGGPLRVLGPIFAFAVAIELCIAMLGSALHGISTKGPVLPFLFGTPRQIGTLFLTTYLFPFEVASLLLLVAAIGAVVLARRRRGLEATEEEFDRRLREAPRPVYTGTMAETTGVRRGTSGGSQAGEQPEPEPAGSASGPTEGGW